VNKKQRFRQSHPEITLEVVTTNGFLNPSRLREKRARNIRRPLRTKGHFVSRWSAILLRLTLPRGRSQNRLSRQTLQSNRASGGCSSPGSVLMQALHQRSISRSKLTNDRFRRAVSRQGTAAMLATAAVARELILCLGCPSNAEARYSNLLLCRATRIPTPLRPTFCSGFQRICVEPHGEKSAKAPSHVIVL